MYKFIHIVIRKQFFYTTALSPSVRFPLEDDAKKTQLLAMRILVRREHHHQQQLLLLQQLIHQKLNHQICFGDNKLISNKIVKLSFNKIVLIFPPRDEFTLLLLAL